MSTTTHSDLKTCFKCGTALPRSEFYPHKRMADGLLGKCKSCSKRDTTDYRSANLDRVRQYDRERGKNPERIKLAAEMSKAWRSEDSRRSACHSAVARAVRRGDLLKQPCCICGSLASVAHHESYDKPLDVMWLCTVHHKARHKELALLGITP
jgi:hypothetical protein